MSNTDSTTMPVPPPQLDVPHPDRKKLRRLSKRKKTESLPEPGARIDVQVLVHHGEPFGWTIPEIKQAIVKWFRSAAAAGYGLSVLLHGILLMLMSLYIVTQFIDENYIESRITSDEEVLVFDEVDDIRIDMPSGDTSINTSLETAMNLEVVDSAQNPIPQGMENSINSLFDQSGDNGEGGANFVVPKDVKIFRKGSFSVWTIPNDPEPGEDYNIVIVVQLPDRVKKYRASDLKGIVIGTDGYRQVIPGPSQRRGNVFLPMKGREAQLVVKVPGAASKVRDTIEIRSTTLKEEQKLRIEF